MGKYYSPNGNYEVWDEKPQGYYTEEEWAEMHPEPIHVPSKEELLAQLEAEYEHESAELERYYNKANIKQDTELMAELREEMSDLEAEYESKRKEIEEAE
jgi:hypothetical protein